MAFHEQDDQGGHFPHLRAMGLQHFLILPPSVGQWWPHAEM